MMIPEADYISPSNLEAEKAVLGAIILESEAYYSIQDILIPDMFYSESNRLIYSTISGMNRNSIPVDMLTVTEELKKSGNLENVGGVVYIVELTDGIGSSSHIVQHSMYIKQEYLKREVMRIAQESIRDILQGNDISDVLSKTSSDINILEEGATNTDTLRHIRDVAIVSIGEAQNRVIKFREGKTNGIPTCSKQLDKITGGWQNGDLIIIAARPAMGKTALALKILESCALSGNDVAMFALEMKGERLVDRFILEKTGIEDWKYKQGNLTNNEEILVENTSNYLFNLPIHIDDSSSQTISRIKAKSRILKKKDKLKLIVIDYLQLTEGEGNANNREQEVARISREAKKMAKDLNVPVIMLSQLNRALETRSDKRPQLSDIRESGAIEQDADMVMFIHRPDYYGKSLEYNNHTVVNGIEIIISKYREGATGSIFLQHDGSVRNIRDYDITPF